VIQRAVYGFKVLIDEFHDGSTSPTEETTGIIDVTNPVQYSVSNSNLVLNGGSKSHLIGFFDPCPGMPKKLRIEFEKHGRRGSIVCGDDDAVSL
jgi:DnaJ family protein C protein 11